MIVRIDWVDFVSYFVVLFADSMNIILLVSIGFGCPVVRNDLFCLISWCNLHTINGNTSNIPDTRIVLF